MWKNCPTTWKESYPRHVDSLKSSLKNEQGTKKEDFEYDQDGEQEYQQHDPLALSEFSKMHDEINDWTMRERLREDLVEHMWARHNATFCDCM